MEVQTQAGAAKNEGEEKQAAFEENAARAAAIQQEIAEAAAQGDFAKIGELSAEGQQLKSVNESVVAEDHQEGLEMNAEMDAEKSRQEAEAAKIAAEAAAEQARFAQEAAEKAAADQTAAEKLAEEIKGEVKAEGGENADGTKQESTMSAQIEKERGEVKSVEDIMDGLKKNGYYKEQFSALEGKGSLSEEKQKIYGDALFAPGEKIPEHFVSNMISSLVATGEISDAKALAEKFPYDREILKNSIAEDLPIRNFKEVIDAFGFERSDFDAEISERMRVFLARAFNEPGVENFKLNKKEILFLKKQFGLTNDEVAEIFTREVKTSPYNQGRIFDRDKLSGLDLPL